MSKYTIFLAFILWTTACTSGGRSTDSGGELRPLYENRYSTRFELLGDGEEKVLRVKNPWQGADSVIMDYRLVDREQYVYGKNLIPYPVGRAICMSSSYVAFLEALDRTEAIAGVSGIDFISSTRLDRGTVVDVGYDNNLNYEQLVSLRPDVMFIYGVTGGNSAVTEKLAQLKIPVVFIADYLEESPLGRAEWIVPFGLLTDRLEQAVERFMHIESEYNAVSELVAGVGGERPKVMLNAPYRDVWYLPGDRSYMVRLLEDAGADYLGKGVDDDSSRPVSSENALLMLSRADYWLNPGMAQAMDQLRSENRRFATLAVIQKGKVFNNNARMTPMGGSDFWETGAVRPDLILKDLVRILHPELLPGHELYFYHALK